MQIYGKSFSFLSTPIQLNWKHQFDGRVKIENEIECEHRNQIDPNFKQLRPDKNKTLITADETIVDAFCVSVRA